jgi:3-oxoacyl-[acyl-carrier protein] reductase
MNIVITGASRGIGAELVKQFASQGHSIIAVARDAKALEQFKGFKNLNILSADIAAVDHKVFVKEKIEPLFEKVDILINNAGKLINKPFEEVTAKELEEVYKVNVYAPFLLTQALIPLLKRPFDSAQDDKTRHGERSRTTNSHSHVVNISSMGGITGTSKFPGLSAYSSSKGALSILTECLGEELKEKGIAVNALALGAVQTEMLEKAFPGYEAPITAKEMAVFIADFALRGHKYFNGKVLPVSWSTP